MLAPVTLDGDRVRLEPVEPRHIDGLPAARAPGSPDVDADRDRFESAARGSDRSGTDERAQRAGLSLVTHVKAVDGREDRIVGATSYMNVDPPNRRLETGFTRVTPAWQRTFVNTGRST